MTSEQPLALRPVAHSDATALERFFRDLDDNGDSAFFEPHPLTAAEARRVAGNAGRDYYVVAVENQEILGYGMLRGWDEGYAIPSLGIAIHPNARGVHLGRLMMLYLHALARRRGSSRVRLRVHSANARAAQLYTSLGYQFGSAQDDSIIGFLDLTVGQDGR